MKPQNHLIIFAKTPVLGRVKRRLARDIGDMAACRFYRNNLTELVRRLGQDGRWRSILAVSPDGNLNKGYRWPRGVLRMPQGCGDLGHRMDRAIRAMPPGPVVLIGTDIPLIRPRHIAGAFRQLGAHDAVFGPSADGGYWLVGLRRRPRMPDIFTGVRWSTEHALADTRANLAARRRIALLEELDDVDDGPAYWKWRAD